VNTFKSIRLRESPAGKKVFDQKVGRMDTTIHLTTAGYNVYLDGDKLDVYKSQEEAEKAASEFVKQYRRN
jgi:hypothetical protein